MRESLNLFRLQKLDTKIDQIHSRLKEINIALSDDHRIQQATKVLEKANAQVKQCRIKLNQIEDKVEAQKIKRKTTQASLFSGKILNPKVLQDLQMESEALRKYISQLEDKQLEAMIAYETAEEEEQEAEKTLQIVIAASSEDNAALLGEKSNLNDALEPLTQEKEAVLSAIPPQTLGLYHELRSQKRGVAITTVTDGGCSICGQALTPADLQSIRSSSELIYCPTCGRILYQG